MKKQNEVCVICGRKDKRKLCGDHNHTTGNPRELLCMNCNAGIGNFKENISTLLKAIEYLKKHNGESM
jgi:hypothetical protein